MSLIRTLAAHALPWLLSTTAHALLLLALVVAWQWHQTATRGANSTMGMQTIFISSGGEDESGDNPSVLEPSGGGSRFYDDEPAPLAQATGPVHEGGGAASTLSALLSEEPSVSLRGALPASGALAGGRPPDAGGIGSARGMTTHPQGSNRLRGGYARTGVFGVMGEGHKFVYVFDRSGSMDGHGGTPLRAAKDELVGSLQNLGQTHQFQIIFYNEHPRVFNPTGTPGRLVFGTDQNKRLAQKFVGSITADGATRHDEALELALRMVPDVIFFLTDADEPRMTAEQLAHIVNVNRGTVLNAIEFGYGAQQSTDNFLVQLAQQNGGSHVYVDVSRLPALRR